MSEKYEVVITYENRMEAYKNAIVLHEKGYYCPEVRKVNPDARPE